MPRFKLNKLVRDNIVSKQETTGIKPHFCKLSDAQHKTELVNKLIEEAKEIIKSDKKNIVEEIADVQQVLDDLVVKHGLKKSDIRLAQSRKLNQNGSFKQGIYIYYADVPTGHPWLKYYECNYEEES